MKVIAQRPKRLLTLLGEITIERAYYYHGRCHSHAVPLDESLALGASSLSSGLEAALCLTSAHLPFAEAAELVERLSGVAVSPVTVQQVAEAVGDEIAAQQQAEQEAAWAGRVPSAPTHVPQRLYVGLDGINVHQLDGYHEMKVAVCYEVERQPSTALHPEGALRLIDPTYLAMQVEARAFGKAVWVEAAKRGVGQAQEVVILGDGAAWIWNIADSQFGPYRCVEIVDWYHATQHVWAIGQAIYGEGMATTREWVAARLTQLWEGHFDAMLAEFEAAVTFRPSARDKVATERTYFETNRVRMRYAEFRAAGYQIGSGSVESACKRVIAARLKQAGMIWSVRGATAMAHLRALVLSRRWDAFWRQRRPPARHYRRLAA